MQDPVDSIQKLLENHWGLTSDRLALSNINWQLHKCRPPVQAPTISIRKGRRRNTQAIGLRGRVTVIQDIWIVPLAEASEDNFDDDCEAMRQEIERIVEENPLSAQDIREIYYPGGAMPKGDRVSYPYRAYEVDIVCFYEK